METVCEVLELSTRTVARWRSGKDEGDARRGPKTKPTNALTAEEKARILEVSNSPEYRDLCPKQIVPLLADKGTYIASESSFYRVLKEAGQLNHREPSAPRKSKKPDEHIATGPNQVWAWDITYVRSNIAGKLFYFYMILDVWSRKIVGWSVHDEESSEHSSALITKACLDEGVERDKLVLHADNGGPMKAATMLATLRRLGVGASFSRPRVSDDNAYAEALFRTLKYRPGYPRKPFPSTEATSSWMSGFVDWYNNKHQHSAIRYITPAARHAGSDTKILAAQHELYQRARARMPARWVRKTRNWTPVGAVMLNPVRDAAVGPKRHAPRIVVAPVDGVSASNGGHA